MKKNLIIKISVITICFACSIPLHGIAADELIGITWNTSQLVSFDPDTGEITATHAQLNLNEAFRGLAYNPNQNILYALSQTQNNLYTIDLETLNIKHLGNLHIDQSLSASQDAGALAYDPVENILYTAIEHWNRDATNIWSELCEVNLNNLELVNKGDIEGPYITSFAFNDQDSQLYGLAVYGTGTSDSPDNAHVVMIDPVNATLTELFETPYATVSGFAQRGSEAIYYAWINSTTHFYGEIDLESQTVTELGNSDLSNVISAMLFKDFNVESNELSPEEEVAANFEFTGEVLEVEDPGNLLEQDIKAGDTISGTFSYDINAPYKDPDPNLETPYGINATVNDLTITSDGFNVGIQNNYYDYEDSGNVYDSFYFYTNYDSGTAWMEFNLKDSSAAALSNNNVLPDDFDVSSWDENVIRIEKCDDDFGICYSITGVVDQITSETSSKPKKHHHRTFKGCGIWD